MNTDLSKLIETNVDGKQRVLLVFNKHSGAYIAAISYADPSTLGGHDVSEFVEDLMDIHEDEVLSASNPGRTPPTIDDYKIVKRSEAPMIVTEQILNNRVANKVTQVYPVVEQINVLARAIKILAEKANVELEELDEMLDYIDLVKQTNAAQRETYMNHESIIYKSNAELAAEQAQRLAGGYYQHLGPQQRSKGSIFSPGQ